MRGTILLHVTQPLDWNLINRTSETAKLTPLWARVIDDKIQFENITDKGDSKGEFITPSHVYSNVGCPAIDVPLLLGLHLSTDPDCSHGSVFGSLENPASSFCTAVRKMRSKPGFTEFSTGKLTPHGWRPVNDILATF